MGRDKGQIARLIRELEERGFLSRSPDQRDKRVWRLAVTAEGEEKCRWFPVIEAKLANDLFAGFGANECQLLEHTFKQLRARINSDMESELK